MSVLIVGATGATGKFVVQQLLEAGKKVKVVVRSTQKLQHLVDQYPNLEQIQGTLLEMSDQELEGHLVECEAVVSCLGHNLTFKGIYGKPRRLVRDTARKVVRAVDAMGPEKKLRYVLMNTTGNANKDENEVYPLKERMIMNVLYALLPPHTDNIQAGEFFRKDIGQDHPQVEWVVVRPDTLIDEEEVKDYEIVSKVRGGAIFVDTKTSRINVANVMSRLVLEKELWDQWKGKMPVVYNK